VEGEEVEDVHSILGVLPRVMGLLVLEEVGQVIEGEVL
jgi:hypothetical protein